MTLLNVKVMNIFYYVLYVIEFNYIFTCISAKKIWKKLEITYEGTNQVKNLKLTYLFISMNYLK